MLDRRLTFLAAAAGAGLALIGAQARAQVTIIGNGLAAVCSGDARAATRNAPVLAEGLHDCSLALDNEALTPHEAAATFVNRGVLYLTASRYADAMRDFDRALAIEPGLAETLVNRGATLLGEGRYAEAASEINRGLERRPTEPEKAYFNRAVAEERLGDLKAAYLDYQMALQLKPDWSLPRTELARFHVMRR